MSANTACPSLLERFFTERLMQQKRASGHTLASYRDTFCLLLRYAEDNGAQGPLQARVGGSGCANEELFQHISSPS